jgi:hypothetical protein
LPKTGGWKPTFYLAESYKQLGMKKEAIDAYQKCKEMMGDPVSGSALMNISRN